MEYVKRSYRKHMGKERFSSFSLSYLQTDLWIGVDPEHASPAIHDFALRKAQKLRTVMDSYIANDPIFLTSLVPHHVHADAPAICHEMAEAARVANVGPMAAVAGAVSSYIGKLLRQTFDLREIVVENGGDIYLCVEDEIIISVFAGTSPLSEKIGLRIPAGYGELGICTSSGTVGPSLSFGKADAAVIACRSAALADAYASAVGNKIQTPDDIEPTLEALESNNDILCALVVCKDKMGIRGEFELEILG